MSLFEEESEADHDYWIDPDTLDMLTDAGADAVSWRSCGRPSATGKGSSWAGGSSERAGFRQRSGLGHDAVLESAGRVEPGFGGEDGRDLEHLFGHAKRLARELDLALAPAAR